MGEQQMSEPWDRGEAADYWCDRAERAERERDEWRVLIDALANRECAGAYMCVGRGVPGKAFAPCEPCAARQLQAGKSVSDAESFRGGATPRAALSADADADADVEPTPWQTPEDAGRISVENMAKRWGPSRAGAMDCSHDSINYSYALGHCRACDVEHVEPSRAEGDEWPDAVSDGLTIPCMRCGEIPAVDYRVDDDFWREVARPHERKNVVCIECLCRDHAPVAEHLEEVQVINGGVTTVLKPVQMVNHATGRSPVDDRRRRERAEGGRPREADPQGPSNGTGDASVDGGGDDGRSRAIEAALLSDPDPDCHYGIPRLRGLVARAIDDALASGGVLDVMEHKRALEAQAAMTDEWKVRVRELEAALRFYAKETTYVESAPPPGELSGFIPIRQDRGAVASAALRGDHGA